jgi:pSer/pThr/pTyr-binding forkhead associated (FHA) protein
MVQLNILSGKAAGSQPVVRRFPFRIGRAPGNELQLDDDGVWDQHLALEFKKSEGFLLATAPQALSTVNGHPVQNVRLRNCDIITLGSVKIRFWLAAARQRGLRTREGLIWCIIAGVTAGQFVLIYWLIR